MVAKVFVSSDRHIGHKRIMEYDNRPFDTIEEHDQAIIDSINETVGKDDILYCLGDVFLCSKLRAATYLEQIKCKDIRFISGNHDGVKQMKLLISLGWTVLGKLHEDPQLKAVFCHYPIQEWRNKHYGWKHYHGHSHHKIKPMNGRTDCTLNMNDLSKPLLVK